MNAQTPKPSLFQRIRNLFTPRCPCGSDLAHGKHFCSDACETRAIEWQAHGL